MTMFDTVAADAAQAKILTRRSMLRGIALTAACAALTTQEVGLLKAKGLGDEAAELKPQNALKFILDALRRFPLVAIGDRHGLQEIHDFLTALLFHPELPQRLTDIVVEFGNARHQELVDRFVLECRPVADTELQQIWRHTVGGGVLWDAPAYSQFFRNVRAVNWQREPGRRLRVLLGDPPSDPSKIRSAADKEYVLGLAKQRDSHYAGIVEREVLAKGRRALLLAGSCHLLRGIQDNFNQPNAVTLLEKRHVGELFVVDPLILTPGIHPDGLLHRVQTSTTTWYKPSCAMLAGTWLGALTESSRPWINSMAYRAIDAAAARYGAQADAVLYLGPGEFLTASRADSAIYRTGDYAAELRRLSQVLSQFGNSVDLVADGLRLSQAGPSWFAKS
jgi:hypothetical protein